MRSERRRDGLRKSVAVDRERAAGRKLVAVAHRHDQRAGAPHLGVQQPDGVGLGIVGAKGVRADELGEILGLVRRRHRRRPHLVQHDRHAGFGELPGGLRAGEAAADDVNGRMGAFSIVADMGQAAARRQGRVGTPMSSQAR